jgi:hypothetical protein
LTPRPATMSTKMARIMIKSMAKNLSDGPKDRYSQSNGEQRGDRPGRLWSHVAAIASAAA